MLLFNVSCNALEVCTGICSTIRRDYHPIVCSKLYVKYVSYESFPFHCFNRAEIYYSNYRKLSNERVDYFQIVFSSSRFRNDRFQRLFHETEQHVSWNSIWSKVVSRVSRVWMKRRNVSVRETWCIRNTSASRDRQKTSFLATLEFKRPVPVFQVVLQRIVILNALEYLLRKLMVDRYKCAVSLYFR